MFKKNLLVLLIATIFSNPTFGQEPNSQIEIWNSSEGLSRLEKSHFKADFYQLANFYQPQENPIYCAVATATMISNAFDYGKILSQKNSEIIDDSGNILKYNLYAQKTFLNAKTQKIKKREIIEFKEPIAEIDGKKIYSPGIDLKSFAKMLSQAHNFKTKVNYVEKNDEKSRQKFRQILRQFLNEEKNFIVVNFDGQLIGNKTRGHIAPLVAYDESSDSVLILDPALHKNQWFWVNVEKIFAAMNSKDDKNFRGYLVVGR